jgi:hypothetical protein
MYDVRRRPPRPKCNEKHHALSCGTCLRMPTLEIGRWPQRNLSHKTNKNAMNRVQVATKKQ